MGRRAKLGGGADGVRGGAGAHVGQKGDTPLHSAASGGHEAVVRMLLDAGADAAAKSKVSRMWATDAGTASAGERCADAALLPKCVSRQDGKVPLDYARSDAVKSLLREVRRDVHPIFLSLFILRWLQCRAVPSDSFW